MAELQRSIKETAQFYFFCGVTISLWPSGHLTSLLILPESVFNVSFNVVSSEVGLYIFC